MTREQAMKKAAEIYKSLKDQGFGPQDIYAITNMANSLLSEKKGVK